MAWDGVDSMEVAKILMKQRGDLYVNLKSQEPKSLESPTKTSFPPLSFHARLNSIGKTVHSTTSLRDHLEAQIQHF